MLATASQRRGAIVLLGLLLLFLGVRLAMNPRTLPMDPDAQVPAPGLADRLDPNTASASELAAIPGLGEKRSRAIVEFRNRYRREHAGKPAFLRVSDLQRVTGIGAATAETISQFLIFPSPAATNE